MKNKKAILSIATGVILLSLAGYGMGFFTGRGLIGGFVTEKSRYVLFFFTPARQYFQMLYLINSDDELKRLAGYYALVDNDLIDSDFLMERYQKETSLAARRAIVWVLSHGRDTAKILGIYSTLYQGTDRPELKGEILKSMKQLDEYYYLQFIKENSIDAALVKE